MNTVRDIIVNLLKNKIVFLKQARKGANFHSLCYSRNLIELKADEVVFLNSVQPRKRRGKGLEFQYERVGSFVICCPHASIPPHHFSSQATTETTEAVNNDTTPVRAPSPIVRPLLPGTMRPLSPTRGPHVPVDPRDSQDLANKKKKGLLSKGKKLLKKLSPVK